MEEKSKGKIKDPKFRLVPMLVHVEMWEKEAIERLGLNASQMVRDFLSERLEKTQEIELAELQAEISDIETELATKKALCKSMKDSLALKKEHEKEQFLEDYLEAFVLKKWLQEGKIPNNTPIFDFPDRELYINDINQGQISVSSELEEFRKYKFKILTKVDPDSRARFKKMFSEFMQSGVIK
ncbi:hypothetical protein [Acidiplasma sp. MBA-1]|uniref:hypothetical protein n=1 Tax=Acidiplasma sp. MBA-1 TaxID=1293648 RepID=UPI0005E83A8B|nr:hypothetical protein [Acidiplasma sp. MBA-1]KJE49294.1 hypothetical protein TZ01_04375 [Acidiplasma sp. MBA-1]